MLYKTYTIAMLSGGLDSTYLCYKLLRDNMTDVLNIHHCQMRRNKYSSQQWAVETACVPKILKWLKKEFPNKHIEFTTSKFEFNNPYWPGWDTTYFTIIACQIVKAIWLQDRASNIQVALGIEKSLVMDSALPYRVKEYGTVFDLMTEDIPNKPTFIKPIVHMSKQEIITDIPVELKDLTWSCRLPQKIAGEFMPCGQCHSCIDMGLSTGSLSSPPVNELTMEKR